MFFPKKEKSSVCDFNLKEYKMKTLPFLFIGFIVGFFSGIFGIGGGILAVPLLTMFTKVPMIFAQGFSVSLIPFNKIGGVFGYMVGGSKVIGVSLPFIGFIDLSLVLICGVLGGISTNIGLKLAKSINQFYLQKIFAVMLLIVALKIIW
jgi:uncharacterized membrane protein YfcA